MKLIPKVVYPLIIITLIVSIASGVFISAQIENNMLERAQFVTAEYISSEATKELTPDVFRNEDYLDQSDVFDSFFNRIHTDEIIKIKVLNLNHDIIYSTSKENIGEKTDSKDYGKALVGEIAVNIKDPLEEQENIDLKGYNQVMEIYVPIIYDGKIEGVIETYYKMDYVNERISEITTIVFTFIGIFSATLIIAVYLILTSVVIKPINALIAVADRITDGELDAKLPEAKSNDEVSNLIASIEMLIACSKSSAKHGSETEHKVQK